VKKVFASAVEDNYFDFNEVATLSIHLCWSQNIDGF